MTGVVNEPSGSRSVPSGIESHTRSHTVIGGAACRPLTKAHIRYLSVSKDGMSQGNSIKAWNGPWVGLMSLKETRGSGSSQQGFTCRMFHTCETAPPPVGAALESCKVPLSCTTDAVQGESKASLDNKHATVKRSCAIPSPQQSL